MDKKKIIKSAMKGKGGPLVDAASSIERGVGNIVSHTKEGAKSAYNKNMAKYKRESGINKTDPIDNMKAGVKGLVGGAVGAGKGIAENLKNNFSAIGKAIKSGVKGGVGKSALKLKDAIKKAPQPAPRMIKPNPINTIQRDSTPLAKNPTSMPLKGQNELAGKKAK